MGSKLFEVLNFKKIEPCSKFYRYRMFQSKVLFMFLPFWFSFLCTSIPEEVEENRKPSLCFQVWFVSTKDEMERKLSPLTLSDCELLPKNSFYVVSNGKIVKNWRTFDPGSPYQVCPRVLGGKGGLLFVWYTKCGSLRR